MSAGNVVRRLLGTSSLTAEQRARSRGEATRVEASLVALGYVRDCSCDWGFGVHSKKCSARRT